VERVREMPPERAEAQAPAVEAVRPRAEAGPAEPAVETRVQETIFLQPLAAPSILGLYGFSGATFVVAAGLIGWYASGAALFVFPFAAFFGGLAQFLAGMWAYRARDGLATAMHGMWGAFWMSYGVLFLLFAIGVLSETATALVGLGWWFIPLGFITLSGATAATRVNWALFAVLVLLGSGSGLAAAGFIGGNRFVQSVAGWVFLFSAIAAWWTATGLMFEQFFGRSILPLGARKAKPKVTLGPYEPGVIRGQ